MLMLNQKKWKTVTVKRPLLDLSIGNIYCKKALCNRKQLDRIDLKKQHQIVSSTKIFINELNVKKKYLVFNCRLSKKGTIYLTCL